MPKTIKQIAEELGVSKETIRRYSATLPPHTVTHGANRAILINADGEKILRDSLPHSGATQVPHVAPTVGTEETQELKHKIELLELELKMEKKNSKQLQSQLKDSKQTIDSLIAENKELALNFKQLSERVSESFAALSNEKLANTLIEGKKMMSEDEKTSPEEATGDAEEKDPIVVDEVQESSEEETVIDVEISEENLQEFEETKKPETISHKELLKQLEERDQRMREARKLGFSKDDFKFIGIPVEYWPQDEIYEADDYYSKTIEECLNPWFSETVEELITLKEEYQSLQKSGIFAVFRAKKDKFREDDIQKRRSQKLKILSRFANSLTFSNLDPITKEYYASEIQRCRIDKK